MHQKKSKKILVYFFLLLIVGSINNKTFSKIKFFQIKNINIKGLADIENEILLSNLRYIFLKNILLINKKEISEVLEKNTLVQNYTILKKYPSTLNIRIEKTKFLAKINKKNKIFYLGSNGKLIKNNNKYELPFIFGNPDINEFLKFKKILDNSKISYEEIKNLYFFPSNRWDLHFKNDILLMLPNELTYEKLNYLYEFLENYNGENFNMVDARIENQIILNE